MRGRAHRAAGADDGARCTRQGLARWRSTDVRVALAIEDRAWSVRRPAQSGMRRPVSEDLKTGIATSVPLGLWISSARKRRLEEG